MITVDKIVKDIAHVGFDTLAATMPKKDVKILKNISVLMNKNEYITENQGKLLLKIFGENISSLNFLEIDLQEYMKAPSWGKPFRKIVQVRKIFISADEHNEKFIDIEFTFSASMKKILQTLGRKIEGQIHLVNGKLHRVPLTEKNVVVVVESYKNHNFDVSSDILNFYSTIKSWNLENFQTNFEIESDNNIAIRNTIKEMLKLESEPSNLILADRRLQFQYLFSTNFEYNVLSETIADRFTNKVHVNSNAHSLTELLNALKELSRFPLLVVFNGYSEPESLKNLEKLAKSLDEMKIFEGVGIYFRFENHGSGASFNKLISEKKYNAHLDENTRVAGIVGGKIPKFFLKSKWKPQAVISFTNNLKHNKSSVYCNDCDLIIYYNDKQPLAVNDYGM